MKGLAITNLHRHKNNLLVIDKIFLLAITSLPGVHKIAILVAVEALYPIEVTGAFVNDIFIVYIAGFLTAINWVNFIMAEMPKLPQSKQPLFWGKIYFASVPATILCVLILIGLSKVGYIVDLWGSVFYLITWSFHQLWRHYYLAKTNYQRLFIFDLAYLALTLVISYATLFLPVSLLTGHALICLLVPVFNSWFSGNRPELITTVSLRSKFSRKMYIKACNFALINVCTGGVMLFFTPLSFQMLDSKYATVVGVCNNVAAFSLLFPRALSHYYLPQMAQSFRTASDSFYDNYNKFQKSTWGLLSFLALVGVIVCIVYSEIFNGSAGLPYALIICLMIYFSQILSQLSLPPSNYLTVTNKHKYLLSTNILSFIIYVFVFVIVTNLLHTNIVAFMSILILHMFTHIFRFLRLNYFTRRAIIVPEPLNIGTKKNYLNKIR